MTVSKFVAQVLRDIDTEWAAQGGKEDWRVKAWRMLAYHDSFVRFRARMELEPGDVSTGRHAVAQDL